MVSQDLLIFFKCQFLFGENINLKISKVNYKKNLFMVIHCSYLKCFDKINISNLTNTCRKNKVLPSNGFIIVYNNINQYNF